MQQSQILLRPLTSVSDIQANWEFFLAETKIYLDLCPENFQAFLRKCLELISGDWKNTIYILFLFIQLPSKVDMVLEKRYNKWNLVKTLSFSIDKVILALLTEVVAFYVRFAVIYVWGSSFQRFVLRIFRGG